MSVVRWRLVLCWGTLATAAASIGLFFAFGFRNDRLGRAEAAFNAGKTADADYLALQVLQFDPRDERALELRARCAVAAGMPEVAARFLNEISTPTKSRRRLEVTVEFD